MIFDKPDGQSVMGRDDLVVRTQFIEHVLSVLLNGLHAYPHDACRLAMAFAIRDVVERLGFTWSERDHQKSGWKPRRLRRLDRVCVSVVDMFNYFYLDSACS